MRAGAGRCRCPACVCSYYRHCYYEFWTGLPYYYEFGTGLPCANKGRWTVVPLSGVCMYPVVAFYFYFFLGTGLPRESGGWTVSLSRII